MKYNKLGRKHVNLYTHCSICDCFLSARQGLNPLNNEPDDLCNNCRREINNSIMFHEDEKMDMELMEQFGWRSYVREEPCYESVDSTYHGDSTNGDRF